MVSGAVVVTSEIRERPSGKPSSISGADDLRMIEGKLPVVVEVAEVATVIDSEASEVNSKTSWLIFEAVSTRVADLDLIRLEWVEAAATAAAAAEAASQAGQGRLELWSEVVSLLELRLSLVVPVVEQDPNLLLLKRITLRTSTLSDSSRESWLRASGSSSRPTGVTRDGLPKVGGS